MVLTWHHLDIRSGQSRWGRKWKITHKKIIRCNRKGCPWCYEYPRSSNQSSHPTKGEREQGQGNPRFTPVRLRTLNGKAPGILSLPTGFTMKVDRGSMERRKRKATNLIISLFTSTFSELTVTLMHCIVSMFKGREAWKGSLIFWKLISVAVLFLPFSFAQTKGALTWAPLWVRYWGRRYCLEPSNKRGHPSLKQPTGTPFLTKPLSWMKWALRWTPQPQKKAPEHLVLSKVVLCTEQRLPGAAFPRHSSGSREGRRRHRSSSSISIRTPFSALPIGACLLVLALPLITPSTGQVSLHMESLEDGGFWPFLLIYIFWDSRGLYYKS